MGILEGVSLLGIILMVIGFILVGIEMIMPGFSFPGIAGIVALIVSIFLTSKTIEQGIILTIIIIVLLGIMLAIILWLLSKGKISRSIVLTEELNKEKGYISSNDLNYLLGKKGVANTDLRPTGIGDFNGVTFDVISSGNYISKGTEIIIKEVKGSKLIVKECKKIL